MEQFKRGITIALLAFCTALLVAACGGGGHSSASGSNSGGGITGRIAVTPASISRMVISGTSTVIDVTLQPSSANLITNPLYVTAVDPTGVFQSAVMVTPGSGVYTLTLTTATTAATGLDTGTLTLNLYTNAAHTTPQQVPAVTTSFSVNELSPTSAWPGDNKTALSAWASAPDWTTFQGNAAHTGYVPVTLDPNAFTTRWQTAAVSSPISSYYPLGNTLTTSNGQFYVADSNTKTLYARSELDGSTVWQFSVASQVNPSVNPPAIANGTVYMVAGQQGSTTMFALNATTGSLVFQAPMASQWDHYLAPTISASGVSYTDGGTYGGMYAFDPTGTQLYFSAMAQTDLWTPAVDASGVYTYTGGVLKVVDPTTGATLHSITDPTFTNYVYAISGAPVLGATSSVFMANYVNTILNGGAIGNTLSNFNLNTNSIQWQIAGDYPTTPAYNAAVLYAANNKPLQLEARGESNGALLWSWVPPQAGETGFASETLLTQNLVFISTNLATYAIDVNTHQTVWSYPQSGRLALSANGILYIQGSSYLTAINVK